ncbi:MAG: site-specific integrase [Frankiales bacterium]|nr:site-specific integrase [Frankiales bacterium]
MGGRRTAGESSIYKDEKGRWHGYVTVGLTADGSRDRRHREGATRAEVLQKVRELEKARDIGAPPTPGQRLTVSDWLDLWLVIAAGRVRPKTLQGYEGYIRVNLKPHLGHHRLDRLQPEHLEAFYAALRAKGLSGSTVLHHHRVLSRALTVAMQRGHVGRNVAKLVDAPSVRRTEVVPLCTEEAQAVLAAARGTRNAARWTVALALGLRQGEVLGTQWRDLDLEAGTWAVRRQLQRQSYRHGCGGTCGEAAPRRCPQRTGGVLFTEPKSDRSRRALMIPTQLRSTLRAHRSAQLEERVAAGSLWQDHDLVFAQSNGRPLDYRKDWESWKALLAAAGVRDARLHDARHTAATLLLEQGVDVRVVMEILGHSQIALTMNTYQDVMPKVVADATQSVADHLLGTAGNWLGTGSDGRPTPRAQKRRSDGM